MSKIQICDYSECHRKAYWEVGFSEIINEDTDLCGDEIVTIEKFCNYHLEMAESCCNFIAFRRMGDKEWLSIKEYYEMKGKPKDIDYSIQQKIDEFLVK